MLGEIFLANFLSKLFGLFLFSLLVLLPIILVVIAYFRKWGVKKFFKRVIESITLIITIVIVVVGGLALLGSITEFKHPVEDMIDNPQKYKNMPCFEVEFNKEKYCFDRSRAYFEKKYIDRTTEEDENAVIYFIPKALSNFSPEDREVRVDLRVDKYHRDDVNEPERLVKATIEDRSKKGIVFKELSKKSKNGEFIEITSMMKEDWIFKQDHFVTFFNNRIIGLFRVDKDGHYKFFCSLIFQQPNEDNYINLSFGSNQPTQKEFLQTSLDIAQEFNQFLSDSKVSNQPLSTNSTTN